MINSPRISNPLCCCEYIDKDGARNHMVACCCNCVELDRAFDSFCCRRNKDKQDWNRVLRVLIDRMRVPWLGGARQVSCDVVLPMILVPCLLAFGALSFPCTIVAFLSMPLLVLQLYRGYFQTTPNTNFFCSWTYTSFSLIFIVYEFAVVPFLELSPHENLVFIGVSLMSIVSLYRVKTIRHCQNWQNDVESPQSTLPNPKVNLCTLCETGVLPRMVHCNTCQQCIPKRELHCLWFGCCIGAHNLLWFVLCLVSLSIALLYSSNLILTTVCRPYRFWGSILLPEDCSEVYYEYRFAICFMCGIYSIVMSVLTTFALIRQCWLISLGITGSEWRTMPVSHLLRLGLTAQRPHSQGVFWNWYYLLTGQNAQK